ncbi:TetR/AcrR family transcriptional regulator [Sphingorhabdus contaminans]|uniref:TetR/AcrR family transcriptional regulator n=1 Tax=Sphingorhabdus contaminans TaxID=1343899 RepID=UPI003D28E50B
MNAPPLSNRPDPAAKTATEQPSVRRPVRHRLLNQARAEETRTAILHHARQAFAGQGFDGTNVRDIAQAAGITHSMVRYHFGTKDQLWREAVREMFALIRAEVHAPVNQDIAEGLSDREVFVSLVDRYVRYCARHPEHARITIMETIRGGERLRWMVDEFVRSEHSQVLPLVKRMMDDGAIARVPIQSFMYGMVGMIQVPFILAEEARIAANYDFMTETAIRKHSDAVIKLLVLE